MPILLPHDGHLYSKYFLGLSPSKIMGRSHFLHIIIASMPKRSCNTVSFSSIFIPHHIADWFCFYEKGVMVCCVFALSFGVLQGFFGSC
mgnify:CR=1 FL=1